ncbi:hypothetical protein GCM10027446_24070 [Angustibacter peucedani]
MPADHDHPGERDADLDAAFAEIVAGWDDVAVGPVPSWPASEDVDPEPEAPEAPGAREDRRTPPTSMDQLRLERDRADQRERGEPRDRRSDDPPVVRPVEPVGPLAGPRELGPRDWELAAQPEDHYEPPEPPPLPRGDLTAQLAWAGLLLGPAFLLFAALFWRDVGRLWVAVAAAAFVGGFVALVVRLPHSRGEDDDDGAVV